MQSIREQCEQERESLLRWIELMEAGGQAVVQEPQGETVDVTAEPIERARGTVAVPDRILAE